MTKVTTVRLDDTLTEQLDALAASVERPRSWLIEQAIKRYLSEQAWQIQAIQEAMDDLDSGKAELIAHEEVMQRLETKLKGKLAP